MTYRESDFRRKRIMTLLRNLPTSPKGKKSFLLKHGVTKLLLKINPSFSRIVIQTTVHRSLVISHTNVCIKIQNPVK